MTAVHRVRLAPIQKYVRSLILPPCIQIFIIALSAENHGFVSCAHEISPSISNFYPGKVSRNSTTTFDRTSLIRNYVCGGNSADKLVARSAA